MEQSTKMKLFKRKQTDAESDDSGRLSAFDATLLAIALMVLSTVFFLLVIHDPWRQTPGFDANRTPVGKFEISKKDVRRRLQNGFAWMPTSSKDPVYEGDSVFTGEDSEASVELEGGTRIRIKPNSFVVIRTTDQGLQLDLQYGNLVGEVKSNAPITINDTATNSIVVAQSGELSISRKPEQKQATIAVISGEAKLIQESNEVAAVETAQVKDLSSNQLVVVDDQGQIKTSQLSISLSTPADGASIWLNDEQPITFSWQASESTELLYEIASDPGFSNLIKTATTDQSELKVTFARSSFGRLYWRVRSGDDQFQSPSRVVEVLPNVPPSPSFPRPDHVVTIDTKNGVTKANLVFAWTDTARSTAFKFQIAKDSDFQDLVTETETDQNKVQYSDLLPGSYFWRIQGMNPERIESPWSTPRKLSVLEREHPLLAPEILSPVITHEVTSDEAERALVSRSAPIVFENGPIVSWSAAEGAKEYRLEYDVSAEFESATTVDVGSETRFQFSRLLPTTYYWRITSRDESGRESDPSEPGQVVVSLPAPRLEPIPPVAQNFDSVRAAKAGKTSIDLKWSRLPFVRSYEVQTGADASFSKVIKRQSTKANMKFTLARAGRYHFRVRGLDANGAPSTPFSEPQVFEYRKILLAPELRQPSADSSTTQTPPPVVPKPEPTKTSPTSTPSTNDKSQPAFSAAIRLLEPRAGTNVVAIGDSPAFVSFRWSSRLKGVSYRIEVAEDPDFTKPIFTSVSKIPRALLKTHLPKGQLYWRVRVEDRTPAGQHSGWTKPQMFNVIQGGINGR